MFFLLWRLCYGKIAESTYLSFLSLFTFSKFYFTWWSWWVLVVCLNEGEQALDNLIAGAVWAM